MANDYSQDYLFPPIAISDLPQAFTAKRTDTLEVNQDGISKQVTVGLINDLAAAGSAPAGPASGDLTGAYPGPTIKTSVNLNGSPTTSTQPNATNNATIATTAFIKNQNYLTSLSLSGYLPLTGGTLTGPLNGTSSVWSGSVTALQVTGPASNPLTLNAVTGQRVSLRINSVSVVEVQNNSMFPGTTNTIALGAAANRWSSVNSVLGDFTGAITGTTAVFSGEITAATPLPADNDNTVATTAWVKALGYTTGSTYLPLAGGTLTGPVAGTSMSLSTAIPLTDNDTSVATTGWVKSAVGVSVGAAPPGTPFDGQLWFNTDAVSGGGKLYIRYNDGNTTQWVPVA